jgi:voltage-gated potassium channel
VEEDRPIAVLAQLTTDPFPDDERVTFIRGNPTSSDDLRRAGVDRAACAIVMADATSTSTAPDDMDARTLLTVLAIESLNPTCYTCVEVVRSENRPHFDRAKADEMVVSAEMTGALLASSAKTHGLSRVVTDLLTHPEGMEFYRVDVPPSLVGATVAQAIEQLKARFDTLFVGVFPQNDAAVINPPADRTLVASDNLLVIATEPPHLT